ncbi:methyltransferase [Marinoscillum pacificum]|uniref:methyltransferase n=1 Tax=Marinoscillum pacificum TaxID=392723 RepID=UPI002158413A|nr:methyltransferase [Marinoscillum pacificum]
MNPFYSYEGIRLKILNGVFHPGLFFSTHVFLEYLKTRQLSELKILELGAGSGLISFYCSREGAQVTASDINQAAIAGLRLNAERNKLEINVVHSDLFENIAISDFDMILINPPYYPKEPNNDSEAAWFCGANFEYFDNLFGQLGNVSSLPEILMILSEDCDLTKIKSIALNSGFANQQIYSESKWGEENYIFQFFRVA